MEESRESNCNAESYDSKQVPQTYTGVKAAGFWNNFC